MGVTIRFFVVDVKGRVHKAEQATFHAVWEGGRSVLELGIALGDSLPVVTVLLDKQGEPAFLHTLRLPIENGFLGLEAQIAAVRTYVDNRDFTLALDRCERRRENNVPPVRPEPSELLKAATEGWPPDLHQQLATALDVPLANLPPIEVGGPLAESRQMNRSIRTEVEDVACRWFCSKCGKAARGGPQRPPLCDECGGDNARA